MLVACLFDAVVIQPRTPLHALLAESTVMVVHQQQAGAGVAGDKNIGQVAAVLIVEIQGDDAQCLALHLMGNPRLLILDEPSEGLAPLIVEALADQIAVLKEEGMTILMAEQNLALALALADHIRILDKGSVRFFGSVAEFSANDSLRHEYLIV